MKAKYLFIWWTYLSLMLCSCGSGDNENDNDEPEGGVKSEIVGIWDIVVTTTKNYTTIPELADDYNREDVDYGNGAYWKFTSSKLTVFDSNDVADGSAVKYSYSKSKGELKIADVMTYKVQKLTSSEMILFNETSDGKFGMSTTIEFRKRN